MLNNIKPVHIGMTLLLLGMVIANVVLTHNVFTEPFPGHRDFMVPLEASRAFWLDDLNPYGDETTMRIQLRDFGRPALPEEDPGYFAYPFYATYFFTPLVNVSYAWASAIWMVLLEICLVMSLFLMLSLFEWQPSPRTMIGLILWMLAFYPSARGLILGQISHLVFLLEILALWAIVRQKDNLAGIALGISTLKPQMGYLFIPFLLLWAWRARRWQFIQAFMATFLILMASAFVIYPDWLSEWLHRLSVYPSYTLEAPTALFSQHYLGLGDIGETLFTIALYSLVLWSWWMVLIQGKTERFIWCVVWTLILTHIVAPRTATPHFVVFTVPIIFLANLWQKHHQSKFNWQVGLVLFALFLLPWVHFLLTVGGVSNEQEDPSVHLTLPLIMLGVMFFSRRLWWEHAPRLQSTSQVHSLPELTMSEA